MAKVFTGLCTTFKKVSGWNTGACKPTSNSATGASNITTMVDTALAQISNLNEGESINIVITCKEVNS